MFNFYIVRRYIFALTRSFKNVNIFIAFLFYIVSSYLGYLYLDESIVSSLSNYLYFIIVTASTVGYGDMSPLSEHSKIYTALYVIPFGFTIFTVILSKLVNSLVRTWQNEKLGFGKIFMNNHILILGWNNKRTLNLIKMLQSDSSKKKIVLCSLSNIENPLPNSISYIQARNYTDLESMQRTNISQADRIIIDIDDDDVTLSAGLFCASQNKQAKIIVYFKDENLTRLMKSHCPNIECIPSVSVEMLAKSTLDPGSSALHLELLSNHKGVTQYSLIYNLKKNISIFELIKDFKFKHDATLIGIEKNGEIILNPSIDLKVELNDKIFYIANHRIDIT